MNITMTNDLAQFIVDQLEAGVDSGTVAKKVASLLIDERRTRETASIMRAIEAELAKRGAPQVTVTSARKVSDEIKNELARLLNVNNPVFSETVDASVIGGVKAESGELLVDLTIKAKLQKFKAEIMRSN